MATMTFNNPKTDDEMEVDVEITSDGRVLLVFIDGEEEEEFKVLFSHIADLGRSAIFQGNPALQMPEQWATVMLGLIEEETVRH